MNSAHNTRSQIKYLFDTLLPYILKLYITLKRHYNLFNPKFKDNFQSLKRCFKCQLKRIFGDWKPEWGAKRT